MRQLDDTRLSRLLGVSEDSRAVTDSETLDLEIETGLRRSFVFRSLLSGQALAIVHGRVVTLAGTLEDAEEVSLALATAESVPFAIGVKNRLRVERYQMARDGELFLEKIRRYLATKANMDERDITIQFVDGAIVLKGTVDNPVRRGLVEERVWEVPGVARVRNEIEIGKHVIAESIRETIDDASISGLIKTALAFARFAVEVTTVDGHVALSGVVKDDAERTAIGAIAQSFRGVKWVSNDTTLCPV